MPRQIAGTFVPAWSVVINNFNVLGIAPLEFKANAPLIIYTYAVLAKAITL